MNAKLIRSKEVVWAELDGQALLVHAWTGARWTLNVSGLNIWKQCDGESSIADIVGYIQHFKLDAKGNGATGTDKWKMSLKIVKGVAVAQNAKFTLALNKIPTSVQSNSPLIFVMDGAVYSK
ncbi:MAG: PqqD family protein [Planctomycetota bacterium]